MKEGVSLHALLPFHRCADARMAAWDARPDACQHRSDRDTPRWISERRLTAAGILRDPRAIVPPSPSPVTLLCTDAIWGARRWRARRFTDSDTWICRRPKRRRQQMPRPHGRSDCLPASSPRAAQETCAGVHAVSYPAASLRSNTPTFTRTCLSWRCARAIDRPRSRAPLGRTSSVLSLQTHPARAATDTGCASSPRSTVQVRSRRKGV
ncbi:hypothetical protein BD413DRAFT_201173 [Trametes elegans]|nr:hypothetical protein BD413DRAFT_201173 [Trametes elegans]